MLFDSTINASMHDSPKDFCKKKRVNRSAELKQGKLNVHREKFLSQVKKKDVNEVGTDNGEFDWLTVDASKGNGKEVRSVRVEVVGNNESDSEESSLENSPTSIVNHNYAGSSGSSSGGSLCFVSGRYFSGSVTEEEGNEVEFGNDDGCLDDWEMVADALVGSKANDKQRHDSNHSFDEEAIFIVDHDSDGQWGRDRKGEHLEEVKSKSVGISGGDRVNNKAWRPDDPFRPQSLPNLSKLLSSPANSENLSCYGFKPWVRKMPPVPTSCPICCEDLDLTDSSFLPCPCGFRLCLFCHKRILEEDSRCPGCRKPYT